jgi:hypothetical protein
VQAVSGIDFFRKRKNKIGLLRFFYKRSKVISKTITTENLYKAKKMIISGFLQEKSDLYQSKPHPHKKTIKPRFLFIGNDVADF